MPPGRTDDEQVKQEQVPFEQGRSRARKQPNAMDAVLRRLGNSFGGRNSTCTGVCLGVGIVVAEKLHEIFFLLHIGMAKFFFWPS